MGRPFKEFNDEKWEQVRTHPYFEKLRKAIVEQADINMTTEPPRVKFSMIHDYVITGNREKFESVYNNYFSRLNNYFSAYMLTKDEKYIEPLSDIIWNICDFESWSIPAHVAEKLSVAERRKNLDLCSTIAGFRLSEVLYFIGDKLPELVRRRAMAEIRYRVIDSYAQFAPDRYWWPTAKNNWSAVCIAAVLGTYIYAAKDEEIKTQLPRMIASAECYLAGFEDDCCCLEGYAYWNYGFSFFCVFASLLNEYTDGEINYFDNPKVRKIAKFQESITLNENECVSFSDAQIAFRPNSWLSHFLKGVYPDLKIPAIPSITNPSATMRYILWQNPDMFESSLNASEPVSFRFEDAQWFIYRCEDYSFACKAGHNKEPHNHNDVGSFMFSKNGKVTLCDPGVGEYTRQYFSAERYQLMLCSSRGHSVPIINGNYQVTEGTVIKDGQMEVKRGKAEIISATENSYSFFMQHVYNDLALRSLSREFVCMKDSVKLVDKYSFSEPPTSVVERFVSLIPFEINDGVVSCCGTVISPLNNDGFEVSFGSEIVDRKGGKKETVYYADFEVKNLSEKFDVEFIIK